MTCFIVVFFSFCRSRLLDWEKKLKFTSSRDLLILKWNSPVEVSPAAGLLTHHAWEIFNLPRGPVRLTDPPTV